MNTTIYYIYGAKLNFPSVSGNFIDNSHKIDDKIYAEYYYPESWKFGYDPTNEIFAGSQTENNILRPIRFNLFTRAT